MNTVILTSVLSAGNHAMFAGTRKFLPILRHAFLPLTPPFFVRRRPLLPCNVFATPRAAHLWQDDARRCPAPGPPCELEYKRHVLWKLIHR